MNNLHQARRARLQDLLRASTLDAAAFVPGPNFSYLTGLHFHLMERPTLFIMTRSGETLAIMPELERLKWSETFPDAITFYWQDSDGYDSAFAAAAKHLLTENQTGTIGVEGQRMRLFEANALRSHLGDDAVADATDELISLRISKDAEEVAASQKAIDISQTALAETIAEVKSGMSEQQILNLLKTRMLAAGAEGFAFSPIVLAGAKAANPHGVSDGTLLQPGDALLIDFGASIHGYNADITRTFFCQHVSDTHADVYQTVLNANTKGRNIASPTLTAHEMDISVTQVLADSPYADLIVHKTGHGLGLDVHEAPQIMKGNHQTLIPGTLFTIEPGLYRKDDIGVRIEDDVLIEEDGARSLTTFDRELQLIG